MTEKTKTEIDQLIIIWDSQGEGKLVLVKDKSGRIRYFITKCGELDE